MYWNANELCLSVIYGHRKKHGAMDRIAVPDVPGESYDKKLYCRALAHIICIDTVINIDG